MTGSPSGAHKEDLMQPLTKRHLCSFTVTSRAHKEDPMQTLAALEPRVQVFSQAASLSWCQTENRGARTTERQQKETGVTRYGGRGLELRLRGEREGRRTGSTYHQQSRRRHIDIHLYIQIYVYTG